MARTARPKGSGKRHYLTADERKAVAAAYCAGVSRDEICREFDTSFTTIRRALHRENVPARPPPDVVPLGQAQERAIADAYVAGATLDELAASFACSRMRISRILDTAGVARRTLVEAAARRYAIDHGAFSSLTPEGAYWLGFAMADGCVVNERTLQISLKMSDADHLRKLHRFVGCPDLPVAQVQTMCVSRINSKRLVADVMRHGVVPRKTWGASASDEVAAMPSFWLGMLDGDGSIMLSRGPLVVLCGCSEVIAQYQGFLAERLFEGRRQRIWRRRDGLHFLSIRGRSAQRLLELLYAASPVSLDRKRERAEELLRWENSRPRDAVFSRAEAQALKERRGVWWGTTEARTFHVADLDRDVLQKKLLVAGFADLHEWKPSLRSSMVAFLGMFDGEPAVIWVSARWKATAPMHLLPIQNRAAFVLHATPPDGDHTWINRVGPRGSSVVPVSEMRRIATARRKPD